MRIGHSGWIIVVVLCISAVVYHYIYTPSKYTEIQLSKILVHDQNTCVGLNPRESKNAQKKPRTKIPPSSRNEEVKKMPIIDKFL